MNKEDKKRLITIRHSMYCRCYYKSTNGYNRYGGRGIKICDEWVKNPQSFYDWAINNGYNKNLTLDRIDVNGDYCPENCRWATREEQNRNKRSNRFIEYQGEKMTLSDFSRKYNINIVTLSDRLKKGMSIEEALNKPIIKSGGYLQYTLNGKTKLLSEWCNIYNINYQTAWEKIKKGKSIEYALKIK